MKSHARQVLAGAVILGLLVGCSSTGADSDEPSVPRTSEPAIAPIVADAEPSARVPLRCEQLASAAAISAAVGEQLNEVPPASLDFVPSLEPYAAIQFGQLDCAWALAPLTFNANPPTVTTTVVAGVTPAQWSEIVDGMSEADRVRGQFSGDSYSGCSSADGLDECRLDTWVNGYWLRVSATAWDGAVTQQTASELFGMAASAVGSAAGPKAAWPVPSGAGPTGKADVASASTALAGTLSELDCNPLHQVSTLAVESTGYTSCTYSLTNSATVPDAFVTVNYLPGGSWALGDAATALASSSSPGAGLGAGTFISADGPGAGSVIFARGNDLVSVHSSGSESDDLGNDAMTKIAVAISGALPAS